MVSTEKSSRTYDMSKFKPVAALNRVEERHEDVTIAIPYTNTPFTVHSAVDNKVWAVMQQLLE